jgi:hypothetical protein
MKKWANELNRTFSKTEVQMPKSYMKNWSTSLAIQYRQVKTTLRFHLTPVTMAVIKDTNNEDAGGKGTLIHHWWECIIPITMENSMEAPYKTKNRTTI